MSAPESQLVVLELLQSQIENITRSLPVGASHQSDMQVSFVAETDIKSNDAVARLIQTIYKMLYKLSSQVTLKMYEENLQAVTTVNYAGRIESVWCESPEADLVDSHLASVQAALELRAAVVRGVVAIGCALASISVAVANPFTAATALSSALELKQAIEHFAAVASENG